MSTGHARLSPSNHRWVHCPGSVREEESYPDIVGEAAIDGTGSHLLLELCLENNTLPIQYEGQVIGVNHEDNPNGWMINKDRIDRVQVCLDYVNRRYQELSQQFPNCELIIEAESRADIGGMYGRDDWYGTCDITITVLDGDTCVFLEVIDYKDGRGWVNATDNSQLLSYLGGKARKYIASGPDKVSPIRPEKISGYRMTIVQPKTMPPIRYHIIKPNNLAKSLEGLYHAALATNRKDAPVIAGKHCQWCKANPKRGGHCNAQGQQSIEVVKTMSNEVATTTGNTNLFEVIQQAMGNLTSLPSDKLAEIADAKDGVMSIFDSVEKEIEKRIETGEVVSGYAMRPGNGSRVWSGTPEEVEKFLKGRKFKKDQIYPAKLISPAQALKLDLTDKQRKDLEDKLITMKAGALKLTKVSRDNQTSQAFEDVQQSAEMMFGDVAEQPAVNEPAEQPAELPSFF